MFRLVMVGFYGKINLLRVIECKILICMCVYILNFKAFCLYKLDGPSCW